MKEILGKELISGDLIYIGRLNLFGIVIGENSVCTLKRIEKINKHENVMKLVDYDDPDLVNTYNAINSKIQEINIDKIAANKPLQNIGDVFLIKEKRYGIWCDYYLIYLGRCEKAITYSFNKEDPTKKLKTVSKNKNVYIKLHTEFDGLQEILNKGQFIIDSNLSQKNTFYFVLSTRYLSNIDKFIGNVNVDFKETHIMSNPHYLYFKSSEQYDKEVYFR